MRNEYNFSQAKRNPYAKKLKRQISINIDERRIERGQTPRNYEGVTKRRQESSPVLVESKK